MEEIGANIWVEWAPLTFMAMPFGTRMTVIRLRDGGLFVHSPVRLTPGLRQQVEALGPVRFLVAPNKLHHLFVGDWARAYPEAAAYAAPGLRHKRPDLPWRGVLGDEPEAGWAAEIDQAILHGSLYQQEVVFLHRRSGTLIVADLLERMDGDGLKAWQRLLARLAGVYRRHGHTRDQRLLVWDRAAARRSLKRILAWDFDRVVLAHGPLIDEGGKDIVRAAFRWLKV